MKMSMNERERKKLSKERDCDFSLLQSTTAKTIIMRRRGPKGAKKSFLR